MCNDAYSAAIKEVVRERQTKQSSTRQVTRRRVPIQRRSIRRWLLGHRKGEKCEVDKYIW